ncbi:MAG TPA: hypothetical protein VFF11_06910, partial [Candidatus Binatia bacterium]|nr:hypothetical protein [Candidatus Binatia bacterium]
AFCKLVEEYPELLDERPATEIPFLPVDLPDRPLTPQDLDWRPLVPPPVMELDAFQPAAGQLEQLRALKRQPGLACEFDSSFLPGGSILENGRPCFGRFSLLVEQQRGLVIGMDVQSGGLKPGEAAGRSLVAGLLKAGQLPEKIFIGGSRLQSALQPLCDELRIELWPVSSLPALEEAVEALSQHMMTGVGPRG